MGLLERLAALAVEQGHGGGFADVLGDDVAAALVGGDSCGGFVHHDIGPQPVNLIFGADAGDQFQDRGGYFHLLQQFAAAGYAVSFGGFGIAPLRHKAVGVGFVSDAAFYHFLPFDRGKVAVRFYRQAEPV